MNRNPYLCLGIVAALAVVAIEGMAGLIVLGVWGREGPALLPCLVALSSAVGSSLGALSAFLVQPPRGSVGIGHQDRAYAIPLPVPGPSQAPHE